MFAQLVTRVSDRFLTERTFELIVAPALADFDYDRTGRTRPSLGSHWAVITALGGAAWHELTADARALATFAGLVVLPAVYYAFLLVLCLPQGIDTFRAPRDILLLAIGLLALSVGPALVCYWPAPVRRTPESD